MLARPAGHRIRRKPWFMWFCPGANHAPHHCPQEYIDKYKGKFDDGYEAYREWVLPRMIEKGILPKDTQLTPINPLPDDVANRAGDVVRPWDTLNADEKKLFSRMAEVYAGFSEYTDAQVGRIIDYLEQTGQLDNTLIFYCADNGASGEGSPNGSVNENKFFNGYPGRARGEPEATSTRSAAPTPTTTIRPAGRRRSRTPFQMFKRYSQYRRRHLRSAGDLTGRRASRPRARCATSITTRTDIVPTILDSAASRCRRSYRGVEQYPLTGVSMRYSFDDADAPTQKKRQYYAMLGTRGIWEDGWKAAALHAPISGQGHFDQDGGSCTTSTTTAPSRTNLAKEHPDKLKDAHRGLVRGGRQELRAAARRSHRRRAAQHRASVRRSRRATATSTTRTRRRSRRRRASTSADARTRSSPTSRSPTPTAHGVIFAHGSRFGGHSLFIKDQQAALRLQLPRHQAGAEVRLGGADAREAHARHGVHAREGGQVRRIDRQGPALRRRQGRRRGRR